MIQGTIAQGYHSVVVLTELDIAPRVGLAKGGAYTFQDLRVASQKKVVKAYMALLSLEGAIKPVCLKDRFNQWGRL